MFTKWPEDWASLARRALGCRGVSRAEFPLRRAHGGGRKDLVCLEVYVQPATETSPVPELAAFAGIPFEELVRWMVEDTSLNR